MYGYTLPNYLNSYVVDSDNSYMDEWAYWESMRRAELMYTLESFAYNIALACAERLAPLPPPRPIHPSIYAGWSQPPRPVDVVVSFDPHASKRDQARAVLYDYYHDDKLRYWSDNAAVKRCLIGGKDPRKENHDPLQLIHAYEHPDDPIWQCKSGGTGMHWRDMDKAVRQAIAHRMKLGPLPKSQYDDGHGNPANPIVIYYYDNDKMKRITYPVAAVPEALNNNNFRWWSWSHPDSSPAAKLAGLDTIYILETDNPRKIQIERENPGYQTPAQMNQILSKYARDFQKIGQIKIPGGTPIACPQCTGHLSIRPLQGSAGGWDKEGFTYDQDVAGTGMIAAIVGATMAVVTAVASVASFGALAAPLGIATPFVVAAVNAADTALHAGDFGVALSHLGPALVQASVQAATKGAGAAGLNIPAPALKALGSTVTVISSHLQQGQKKKLEFSDLWDDVAQKAKSFGKLGDAEALAIATMLGGTGDAGNEAGHVFVQGYLAGKFLDLKALGAIAKLLQSFATFADPRIINIALLGMGIGYLSKSQEQSGSLAARGEFDSVGQIIMRSGPHDDLDAFVFDVLGPRYGLSPAHHAVGFDCPPGYEAIEMDHQIGCAFRGKAACLAGRTDVERGVFVCTMQDFNCPPGMETRRGSPANWCFPAGSHFTGQSMPRPDGPPDWSWPALGCPHGYWRDDLGGQCSPLPAKPVPRPFPPPVPRFS